MTSRLAAINPSGARTIPDIQMSYTVCLHEICRQFIHYFTPAKNMRILTRMVDLLYVFAYVSYKDVFGLALLSSISFAVSSFHILLNATFGCTIPVKTLLLLPS